MALNLLEIILLLLTRYFCERLRRKEGEKGLAGEEMRPCPIRDRPCQPPERVLQGVGHGERTEAVPYDVGRI